MSIFLSIMAALVGGAVAKSAWVRSRPAAVAERARLKVLRKLEDQHGMQYCPMAGEPVHVVIE